MKNDFEKYAVGHLGINSHTLYDYTSAVSSAYVSPTIIEERQLNVAAMDVFSRLMMDRIIFLGAPVSDDVANIIQAQLLYLEPVKNVPNEFNMGMDNRRAIYIPFAQAVPKVATIDANYCNMLKNGKCGVCSKFCTVVNGFL